MRYSEVSSRYASALFELSQEQDNRQKVFESLLQIKEAFRKDETISQYIYSEFVKADEKEKVLGATLKNVSVEELAKNLVLLLARRGRIHLFDEVIDAFQDTSDVFHGVTRGTVKAATALSEDQQKRIEDKISSVTGKKVILSYECDPKVIGGLIAEVGGYVFDDTVTTHLRRLKEDIKRRAH
jgi:F-type H+-transporting ATPase subunit delta